MIGLRLLCAGLVSGLLVSGCGAERATEPIPAAKAAEPQTAELGWREAYPPSGPQLRFHVDRLEVQSQGWSAQVAVENATPVTFELGARPLELRFGLMLFASSSLDELEEASREGTLPSLRRAVSIDPPPPDALRPGQTWRTTLSAPGSLADGSFVRVSFGTLVARGEPPPEMQPAVVWITDKAHKL